MLRRNGVVIKSPWERFVKEVGLVFEPRVEEEGVMDGESGELTESEDVVGA